MSAIVHLYSELHEPPFLMLAYMGCVMGIDGVARRAVQPSKFQHSKASRVLFIEIRVEPPASPLCLFL